MRNNLYRTQFQYRFKKFSQLEMTLYVTECLLPDYMDGLSQLYNSSHIHKYYDERDGDGDGDQSKIIGGESA